MNKISVMLKWVNIILVAVGICILMDIVKLLRELYAGERACSVGDSSEFAFYQKGESVCLVRDDVRNSILRSIDSVDEPFAICGSNGYLTIKRNGLRLNAEYIKFLRDGEGRD